MDDRLSHRYNTSNFGRSLRDAVWYAGQVAVLGLAYHDHPRGVYLVLAAFALFVAAATAVEAAKWRRELRRDRATGRAARADAAAPG